VPANGSHPALEFAHRYDKQAIAGEPSHHAVGTVRGFAAREGCEPTTLSLGPAVNGLDNARPAAPYSDPPADDDGAAEGSYAVLATGGSTTAEAAIVFRSSAISDGCRCASTEKSA
jgi:hypothetical protein